MTDQATRERPGGATEKVKKSAEYLVFISDNGALHQTTKVTAANASQAASKAVESSEELVGKSLVVVPERNYKVFSAQVETKTKVKVTAA